MHAKITDFGHIVWLTESELEDPEVMQELERLKAFGRIAVLCSGKWDSVRVLEKLLRENKELSDS